MWDFFKGKSALFFAEVKEYIICPSYDAIFLEC